MKKIVLIALVIMSFGCGKEETPQPTQSTPVVSNTLTQVVDGNVTTSHSFELDIYEEINGSFQLTKTNTYTLNSFPYTFIDNITNKFYYEVILHNNSTFTNTGNGVINATITYQGDVIFLEADENTWSENYTSSVYNN